MPQGHFIVEADTEGGNLTVGMKRVPFEAPGTHGAKSRPGLQRWRVELQEGWLDPEVLPSQALTLCRYSLQMVSPN